MRFVPRPSTPVFPRASSRCRPTRRSCRRRRDPAGDRRGRARRRRARHPDAGAGAGGRARVRAGRDADPACVPARPARPSPVRVRGPDAAHARRRALWRAFDRPVAIGLRRGQESSTTPAGASGWVLWTAPQRPQPAAVPGRRRSRSSSIRAGGRQRARGGAADLGAAVRAVAPPPGTARSCWSRPRRRRTPATGFCAPRSRAARRAGAGAGQLEPAAVAGPGAGGGQRAGGRVGVLLQDDARGCALVVCHAGHGTLMRALTLGRPVVAVPHAGDMPENAARVDWAGAGVRLPWPLLSPGDAAARRSGARLGRRPRSRVRARQLAAWASLHDGAGAGRRPRRAAGPPRGCGAGRTAT